MNSVRNDYNIKQHEVSMSAALRHGELQPSVHECATEQRPVCSVGHNTRPCATGRTVYLPLRDSRTRRPTPRNVQNLSTGGRNTWRRSDGLPESEKYMCKCAPNTCRSFVTAQHGSCYTAAGERGGGAFINNENKANFSVNTAGIVTYAQETFTGL